MERTSGKYYVLSALKRKYADRIPTTVLIGPYCCKMTGYSVKQILTDPQKSAEAHLAFYNRFEPDSLIVYNDIYLEAEAIGCELEFFDDRPSHPKSVVLGENPAWPNSRCRILPGTGAYPISSSYARGCPRR